MPTFEITAAGFNGATSDTDELVYWVAAPSITAIQSAIADTGAKFCGYVEACHADIDFTLPQDTLRMQEALLTHASDARNAGRS